MTLAQLIAVFRADTRDDAAPYLWSDTDVTRWLNEAEEEAAIRARLLFDTDTPAYCQVAVISGTRTYGVDGKVIEIVHAELVDGGGDTHPVDIFTDIGLERVNPTWREDDPRCPEALIHRDKSVTFDVEPDANYTLNLEVYRLPVASMTATTDSPEIADAHHLHLVKWAIHRAYGVPDTDGYNAGLKQASFDEFEGYFGPRPNADLRKYRNAARVVHARFGYGF